MSENRHGAYILIRGDRKIYRLSDITVMEENKAGKKGRECWRCCFLIMVVREGLSKKEIYMSKGMKEMNHCGYPDTQ